MNTLNFKEIIEQSSAFIAVVNPDFKVLSASNGFLDVTNNNRENIIGRPIFDVFPEIRENIEEVLIHTMRDSLSRVLEHKIIDTTPIVRYDIPITNSENGGFEVRYWKAINTPILDTNRNVKYIQQFFIDVTHSEVLTSQLELEKENLNEYKTADQYISKAFKQAPAPICVLRGPKHVFELVNREFLRIVANKNIIGKPAREAMPELESQGFFDLLDQVYESEKSYSGSEVQATFNLSSDKQVDVYVDFVIQILYDSTGEKDGIFILGSDVTKQVIARKKAEDSEYKFRKLVEESPVAMAVYIEPNNIIKYANDKMLNYWGKDTTVMGMPLYGAVPELKHQPFLKDIEDVFDTGETHNGIEEETVIFINGKPQTFYFNYTYKALRNKTGKIYGVQNVVIDVTEQVLARKEAESSEYKYRMLLEESSVATALYTGPDFIIDYANEIMLEYFAKDSSILGEPLFEAVPSLQGQPFYHYLEEVYATGKTYTGVKEKAKIEVNEKEQTFYFNFTYSALRDKNGEIYGILNTAIDVTQEVIARMQVEESEYRYRMLIEESTIATALFTGPDIVIQYANDIMLDYWGKDESVIGKPLVEALPELKGQNFIGYLKEVYATGNTHSGVEEEATLMIDGKPKSGYFNYKYKALRDKEGKIYGIHHTAIDVTEQVLAKKALVDNERMLRNLLNSMPQKISHTDSEGNVVFFNQKWMEETGFAMEDLQDNGWINTIHPDDFPALKENWVNAVETGSEIEVECRIKHKELGYRWNLTRSVPIHNKDGDVIMWVASNTDIHEQKKQKEILEKAVEDRTKELEKANKELIIRNEEIEKRKEELVRANKELESFAYVSSHDLQEPLRKIQIFADRILEGEARNLSERGKDYFERMEVAAGRMQILIEDLLSFSRVNNAEKTYETINLKKIVDDVKEELAEIIESKNAIIETPEYCDVNVIVFQFRQLMKNLLSNALKFSKPGVPPHILIKSVTAKGSEFKHPTLLDEKMYCHMVVSDNGIGFEPRYNKRIFEIFQRLYGKDDFPGTGIGLAIVKKIVENHDGIINATGEPNVGATFDIYIPA